MSVTAKILWRAMPALLWVLLAENTLAELLPRQLTQLSNNCTQCHAQPRTGAPLMGDEAVWEEIMSKGEDAVLVNVVQGLEGMPPMGYCSSCTEEDFRQLIRLMAGGAGAGENDKQ